MRQIFISAGHSNTKGRDRGASGCGYIEGELTVEFRNLLLKEIEAIGYSAKADGNNTILSESIAFFKKLVSSNSILLDIHWNAAGPTATGVETIVPNNPSDFEVKVAREISEIISDICKIPLRGNYKGNKGVKTEAETARKSLGWMRLLGENILVEMGFITNCEKDMKAYQTHKHTLAKLIAKCLVENALGKKLNTPNEKIYTVTKGDTLFAVAKYLGVSVSHLIMMNKLNETVIKVGQKLKY